MNNKINWKADGVYWSQVKGEALKIAFGPEGLLYKVNYENYFVYVYNAQSGEWTAPYGTQTAYSLSVDNEGSPWIVTPTTNGLKRVKKWDSLSGTWLDMNMAS